MLSQTLRFVRGSVAKKDLLPALTNFRIEGGRVQGYNGKIAISAPIDFQLDCTPKATPLVNAIDKCTDEAVQFSMTKAGKLAVKSGKFRAYIECVEGPTAHVQPSGSTIDIDGETFMKALTTLFPLIGQDANRAWSNGIRFHGCSAYATNNVIAAQYWLGAPFPVSITLPRDAVKELLRIGESPVKVQVSEVAFTAHYSNGVWIWCQLIEGGWPDIQAIIEKVGGQPSPVPEEFFTGLDNVRPFVDKFGRIILEPGLIRTVKEGDEMGASYELDWIKHRGHFNVEMLMRLDKVAQAIDLSTYPEPCMWYGDGVRGVIIGLRWLEDL